MLAQRATHIAILHEQLECMQTRLTDLLEELKAPAFDAPTTLARETNELQRATKHLNAKRTEYDTRLAALKTTVELPDVGIMEIVKEEKALEALKERVAEKEARVKAYQGLPHDKDLAKLEVERVRREVRKLVGQRDRLFEELVEGGV
jgi:HAUS augmin-like complex subunit 1